MNWVLAVAVTAAVCVFGSIAVRRGEPKSYDEPGALLPPFLTVITGVTLSLFYFGLDYVLSTITGTPNMAEPVFSHSAPETLTVLAISLWLTLTGLWVLAARNDSNQRMTARKIEALERELRERAPSSSPL